MVEKEGLKGIASTDSLPQMVTDKLKALSLIMSKDRAKEEKLKEEEKELEERLKGLEFQDPRSRPERTRENAPEEEGDEAEGGSRAWALKRLFIQRLRDVRDALGKLRRGSYGICDRCGEKIDPARLKAKPDARYCLECARELESR